MNGDEFVPGLSSRFFRGVVECKNHAGKNVYAFCLYDMKKKQLYLFARAHDLARAVFLLCTMRIDEYEPSVYRVSEVPGSKLVTSEIYLEEKEHWLSYRQDMYREPTAKKAMFLNEDFGEERQRGCGPFFRLSDFTEDLEDVPASAIKEHRFLSLKRMAEYHQLINSELELFFHPEKKKEAGLIGLVAVPTREYLE